MRFKHAMGKRKISALRKEEKKRIKDESFEDV